MKKLVIAFLASLCSSVGFGAIGGAVGGSYIMNQNTLQAGTTFFVSSGTAQNFHASTITFSDGSFMTKAAISGSGASALQVTVNGTQISCPTASIGFDKNFIGFQSPVGTSNITLNPGTTLYIQNTNLPQGATFYVSSGTVGGQLIAQAGSMILTLSPSTTQAFQILNQSSEIATINFYGTESSRWKIGSDVMNQNVRVFGIKDEATGVNVVQISTMDVFSLYGTMNLPMLTPSMPVKTNASSNLVSAQINLNRS